MQFPQWYARWTRLATTSFNATGGGRMQRYRAPFGDTLVLRTVG